MSPNTRQQVRSQGFAVVECDIPEGMTMAEYRAARKGLPARRKWRVLALGRRSG